MNEVFIVKNQTVSTIELFDFGVLILPDASAELGNFDDALLSEQLQSLLQTGDLVRLVNGAPVAYANANTIFYGFDVSANDASIKFLNDSKVDRAGDTITGRLNINASLNVQGNIYENQKIKFNAFTNTTDPSFGDLWIDASLKLNYRYPITTADASSFNLTDRLLRSANDWINFTDSSVLVKGDRILIEQAATGYKKAWISSSAFAHSIGALNYASYNESTGLSTTTSKTLQNKLTLTTDASAPADTYRLGWTFQIANGTANRYVLYRVRVDSSIIEVDQIRVSNADTYWNVSGFQHIQLGAGAHNVYIDYCACTNTAKIKYARLEFAAAQAK